jgi:hypothetical protein
MNVELRVLLTLLLIVVGLFPLNLDGEYRLFLKFKKGSF